MRVLVVEDEPIAVESICRILQDCALVKRVATARTGPQMIERCRQEAFDLILLDIVIPGFDGLSALAEVRRFRPDCLCLVTTAREDIAFAQRAIRLGVIDYLLKPIGKKTLLLALERASRHLAARAPARGEPGETEPPLLPPCRPAPREGPVATACAYLKEHYMENGLSLEDTAALVGLSPSHFSRAFKEQAGEKYVDYLTRLRLNAAASLLRQTLASVRQIALAVGYSDPNYLSRIFHRRTGVSPKEYRDGASTKSASPPAILSRG